MILAAIYCSLDIYVLLSVLFSH